MARRVEALPSFPVLSVALILLAFTLGGTVKLVQSEKTWCVAKPSSDDATLQENINYVCSQVDCNVLKMGGPCFYPDNRMSHASVAMNLYYQSKGRNPWNCNFKNTALLVVTNPSFGSCAYP